MAVDPYEWPLVTHFIDREEQLSRLEDWWGGQDMQPLNLYGRRRTGKSWLFKRFAHGKPAVVLVGRQEAVGSQLTSLAESLEPLLGVTPALPDVASLFRVLFRAGRGEKLLERVAGGNLPPRLSQNRA